MAVAQRMYARALLEAAEEQDRVQPVREQLADFVEAIREVPELRELLRNPQVDPRAKVSILEGLLEDADELVRNFILLVTRRGRAAEIEEMDREFERLVARHEGRIEVELTTAVELPDDEAQEITEQIEQAAGRRVEATRKVDPNLIGGIVLQIGSMRVDASVRGRLNRLRRELVTR
jgi:F-type H+-transporting ATPase subunit delta